MSKSQRETAAAFVSKSPWGRMLERLDLERVLDSTKERIVPKRGAVVRASSVAQFWVGIISGLVVQSVTNSDGHASFLSAASDGAWFGEGTLMKRERWGYDAVALQETRVALIPLATFEWLRETNLPFNSAVSSLKRNEGFNEPMLRVCESWPRYVRTPRVGSERHA
jgi:CRP/FNR family cyclic AMP-dependent transcriptional regulator